MPTYTVHEAKTHLSKLIERGEEVIIARGDKPAVRLAAVEKEPAKKGRRPGAYAGLRIASFSIRCPRMS